MRAGGRPRAGAPPPAPAPAPLTACASASSLSLCRSRPCRRTRSPSASASRPFSSVHRPWSFRSDCSSSDSSTSYLSRMRLTLAGQGQGQGRPAGHSTWAPGLAAMAPRQKASPALGCPLALLPGQRHVGLQPVDDQLDLLVPASPDLLLQLPFPVQQPCFLQGAHTGSASGGRRGEAEGPDGTAPWALGTRRLVGMEGH